MIKQLLSVGAGPQAPCALNHLEGDQMEEQGLCLRPQGLTREGCSGLGPLTQWMDSGRQLLPSMVPDNRILARQPFVKFGAEDCLLLTLPCLSIWGSLFLEPCFSCTRTGGGFSLAIPGLRDQRIGVVAIVTGQHQADQAGHT